MTHMRPNPSFTGIVVALAMLFGLTIAPALAQRTRCPTGDTVLALTKTEDTENACRGIADAKGFLNAAGLKTDAPVEVRIVAELPDGDVHSAFGCFNRDRREIDILDSGACRSMARDGLLFGLPLGPDLYRSLVAHEVAHAIATANSEGSSLPWVAQEYIAYVTQLASLPANLNESILEQHPEQGFPTGSAINSYLLMASPEVFAVKAYRHFAGHEDGHSFLRGLLTGKSQVHWDIGRGSGNTH